MLRDIPQETLAVDEEADPSSAAQSRLVAKSRVAAGVTVAQVAEVEVVNRTARRLRIDGEGGEGRVLGPFCVLVDLVDLVDQGILYLHARDEQPDAKRRNTATLRKLNACGIRTATDFEQVLYHPEKRTLLERAFGADAVRLELLVFTLEEDEWMPQLRSWREFRRTYDTTYTADQLEDTTSPRRTPA